MPDEKRSAATDREAVFSNPFSASDRDAEAHDDHEDEPKPASMAMTKDELLDRLRERASEMTKAEILALLERMDADEDEGTDEDAAPAGAASAETREVTIDGRTYQWTEATEHTVPEEARLVYARSKAAGG